VTAPLAGLTVLVTRPRAQAARFAARVAEAGGTVLLFPAIEIEPIELDATARGNIAPDAFDWIIYTSANAVLHSLRQLPRPARARIAAIGRATARALQEQGLAVHAVPTSVSESEGLLALDPFRDPAGQRILIVKGEGGRTLLREELVRRGAEVATVEVYRRVRAGADAATLDRLARSSGEGRIVVAATSAETLAALLEMVPASRIPGLLDAPLLVPGERVAVAARERGWHGQIIVAASAEDATMFAALVDAAGQAGVAPGGAC
jgi:uroporphyrinogen-III synthase